ncbi:50S ribosomal protein L25 [Chloroflexota bacterium]
MEKIELEAAHREILGKKVRHLRRREITPAHLFGHDVASLALQCQTAEIKRALTQAGKTGLISLKLDTAKKPRSVLIREIQKNPCTDELLHVDFYEVKTTEKIKVDVPVVLVGEAPALKVKDNILIQDLDSLSVECFPDKIPSALEVDLSSLAEAEQAIRVKDLALAEGVAFTHEDPELVVVKISVAAAARVEEEEEVVTEAPEAAPPEETAEE